MPACFSDYQAQLAWPLAARLTLWTLHDWKKRQRFLWGFCVTGAALALGAELVLPGWISEFRDAITAYQQYTHAQSVVQTLTSPTIGAIINWLILVGIALICWRARRIEAKTDAFVAVSSLVLAATVVVVPALSIYNHILLFPSVFLLLRNWDLLWNANPLTRGVGLVAVSSVLWPWVTCLALLAATSFVPFGNDSKSMGCPTILKFSHSCFGARIIRTVYSAGLVVSRRACIETVPQDRLPAALWRKSR